MINSLVNSQLVHRLMALPSTNEEIFIIYKAKILRFIWNDKPHKISYDKLVQHTSKLGLKLQDLQAKDIAFKAMWPIRLKEREYSQISWVYNNLPIKDARIWLTNTSLKDISKLLQNSNIDITKHIWLAWSKYNFEQVLESPEQMLDTILGGNSLIRKANAPIWDGALISSNIDKIMDIYDPIRKSFLSYETLTNIFGPNIKCQDYCSILAAIPTL